MPNLGSPVRPLDVCTCCAAQLFFFWGVLPAYGAAAFAPSMVLDRAVYVRERADGLYRPITYLTHKVVEELILALIYSVSGLHNRSVSRQSK